MPRKKKGDGSPKSSERSAGRRRTVKPNGGLDQVETLAPEPAKAVGISEAMDQAVQALGPTVVDDTVAGNQLRELAGLYEEVERRQAAYTFRADAAKTAKESLEIAKQAVFERLKAFTRQGSTPLLDAVQQEADVQKMVEGEPVPQTEDPPQTVDEPRDQPETMPPPVEAPPEPASADTVPF